METTQSVVEYERTLRGELEVRRQELETEIAQLRAIRHALPDVVVGEGPRRALWTRLAGRTEDATFETVRGVCEARHDDPALVYVTPHAIVAGRHVRFVRDYLLGTRTPTTIVPAEDWESEMRRDGVPEPVIGRCRSYLAEHAR